LKYYEQTIARNTIKDLSNELFEKFVDLAENETDSNLKDTYEFLAAYWAVPAILLLDKDDFRIKSNSRDFFVDLYS
jgi:predicted HTH transcriptional regulator